MQIRQLGPQIGAEITDVDVRNMDESTFRKIYQAWLDFNVVTVRGQDLTVDEFRAYSRRFGDLYPHRHDGAHHTDYPDITVLGVNKFKSDGKLNLKVYARGAGGFHTDGAYDADPPKATQLYALAIPSRGGDTCFASMYAAYDALPDTLRKRLAGVRGAYVAGGRRDNAGKSHEELRPRTVFHPILRAHPETRRMALYFDPTKLVGIEGLTSDEGNALIEEVRAYMIQPAGEYRHKWSKGDIVIWDNRCSYHKAAGDYPPEEDRIHWRACIRESAKHN